MFASSVGEESEFVPGIEILLKGTAAEWIAANKKAYIAPDLAKEERQYWTDDILFWEGMTSVIRIPLFSRGEVIGTFCLASRQQNAFSEKEQQILEEIAPLLAVAIEKARAEEGLRTERDKLHGILSSFADGMDIVSRDYRVHFQNKFLTDRFGDLRGRLCYEGYMARSEPCEFCPMLKAIQTNTTQSVEVVGADGRHYEVTSTPLVDTDGETRAIEVVRDITERKRAEEALQESEEKYRHLFEDLTDAAFLADAETGLILKTNLQGEALLGKSRDEIVGMYQRQLHPADKADEYRRRFADHIEKGHAVDYDGEVIRKDGTIVPVRISASALTIRGQHLILGLFRDITERKRAEEEHQRYTKRVEALHAIAATVSQSLDLDQMLDGVVEKVMEVVEVDAAMIYTVDEVARDIVIKAYKGLSDEFVASIGRIRAEEEEVERMMGWRESTIALDKLYNEPNLTKIREAGAKEGVQSSVTVGLWSKGILLGSLTVHCRHPHECTDEDLELLQAIASEIAVGMENARLFAEMSHSASTDELTGLYNHRHFQERLEEEVARVHRFAGECSVIMLDLDHFKIYNDLFGHVAGDEVLKRLGQVLRDHTRQIDIACRYGGEEFVITLPHTGSSEAYQAAERLRQAIEQAFSQEVASTSANLTVSLGIASYPIDGLSREALIRGADLAMREAKQRGRNQTCLAFELVDAVLVEDDMERETVEHLEAASLNTIYALAAAVDARDHYTYGHSRNVSKHAVAIGKALGLSRRKLQRLRIAALLHDIGKIGLSDSIIRKLGPLDEGEWEMMRKHSELGATIISHTPELADCAPAIRHHHEWQDGSGYPDGLKGEDIPLEARIIAIADAYDTMTTPRAYRETVSPQEALEELRRCANTQFDPQLVETFTWVANSGVRAPAELSPL